MHMRYHHVSIDRFRKAGVKVLYAQASIRVCRVGVRPATVQYITSRLDKFTVATVELCFWST